MSLLKNLVPSTAHPTEARRETNGETKTLGPTVRPSYRIKETDEAFGVIIDLPGVTKEGIEVSAENGVLTVVGRREWKRPETWTALYREATEATFLLSLRHDASVDVDRIHAELRDGVLRLSLPKSEAFKPRKISVN